MQHSQEVKCSETVRWLARLLNKSAEEVEKAWRSSKRYCSNSGHKGNYLRILAVTLSALKANRSVPVKGSLVTVGDLKATVVDATAEFAVLEADDQTLLLPLWALPFTFGGSNQPEHPV